MTSVLLNKVTSFLCVINGQIPDNHISISVCLWTRMPLAMKKRGSLHIVH